MDTSKEGIRRWLSDLQAKRSDRDRAWLAEECSVSPRTVDNWLSSPQPIPAKATRIIERLMQDSMSTATDLDGPAPSALLLRIDTDELDEWTRAFKRSDAETLSQWAVQMIRKARLAESAADGRESPGKNLTLMVAEDEAPYGSARGAGSAT